VFVIGVLFLLLSDAVGIHPVIELPRVLFAMCLDAQFAAHDPGEALGVEAYVPRRFDALANVQGPQHRLCIRTVPYPLEYIGAILASTRQNNVSTWMIWDPGRDVVHFAVKHDPRVVGVRVVGNLGARELLHTGLRSGWWFVMMVMMMLLVRFLPGLVLVLVVVCLMLAGKSSTTTHRQ